MNKVPTWKDVQLHLIFIISTRANQVLSKYNRAVGAIAGCRLETKWSIAVLY